MNEIMVTIVIPYYRTHRHQMVACVNSIINQTYNYLEILVVDDGSGKDYSSFLQEIEAMDKRIRVLYKDKNEGLSAARNYGLKYSKGSFVMFVDSDDVIHSSSLENMLTAQINTNADMVIGEMITINNYNQANISKNEKSNYEVMNKVDAIDRLLRVDGFGSTACGRLARKEVWHRNGLAPFITGILHEDLASMWEIINNCEIVCFLGGEYYYYYQGSESDIHTKVKSKKFCYDFYDALKNRNKALISIYPGLNQSIAYSYILNIPLIYNYSYETEEPREYKSFRDSLMSVYRSNYRTGIKAPNITTKSKCRYWLFLHFPYLYINIYKMVRKKKGMRI